MDGKPELKVVPIRNGAPLLNDLPGQLRALADRIESGEDGPFEFLIVAAQPAEFRPLHWGWGNVPQRHQMAGFHLHLAQLALTDAEQE